jgi:CheY-like chemotaxis protein
VQQARVLVVDDTPQIRMLLRVNLELEGAVVTEASDGGECLQVLADLLARGRPLPHVVTLDALMEPVDGWSTAASIRRDPALAHLPLVMITASVQAHHQQRAAAVGVDAFIAKPFDPHAVLEVVRGYVGGRRAGGPRLPFDG